MASPLEMEDSSSFAIALLIWFEKTEGARKAPGGGARDRDVGVGVSAMLYE
jgi:hypothetical protein